MKRYSYFFIFLFVSLFFISCEEDLVTTNEVFIQFKNVSYYNTDNLTVDLSIVFFESDQRALINFGEHDISNGKSVELGPVVLNPGNYYVRFKPYVNRSPLNSGHQPFQVQLGEPNTISVDY